MTSFRPQYGPGVDSASNRNEYQEYFLVGNGRCVSLTNLPLSCATCLEIWEPQPGNLGVCPGIAFTINLSMSANCTSTSTVSQHRHCNRSASAGNCEDIILLLMMYRDIQSVRAGQ